MKSTAKRFMSWRDMTITPVVWLLTLIPPVYITWILCNRFQWTSFTNLVVFAAGVITLTLIVLKAIRVMFPLRQGVYSLENHPWVVYTWNLASFLCITNLSFQYMNALIPPLFRKIFYQLMGAKMGNGIISIGGRITEPSLVTIEENVMLGDDALILAHAVTAGDTETLVLAPVAIRSGAVVGARVILMPGVVIGEKSMIKAMSLVTMNTHVPPNEIWGGIPARKMGDVTIAD